MYGLDIVALFFAAAFKFFFSMPSALLLGYSYWETVAITSAGGISSAVFFYVFSSRVMEHYRQRQLRKMNRLRAAGKPIETRNFTFVNKLMVRIKHSVGMVGIAAITPTILSIPIGAVVSAKFFKHRKMMLPSLIISVVFWSMLITWIAGFIKFS